MPALPPQRPNAPFATPDEAAFLFERAPISDEWESMSPTEFFRHLRVQADEMRARWEREDASEPDQ